MLSTAVLTTQARLGGGRGFATISAEMEKTRAQSPQAQSQDILRGTLSTYWIKAIRTHFAHKPYISIPRSMILILTRKANHVGVENRHGLGLGMRKHEIGRAHV